ATTPSPDEARQSLTAHVAQKGQEIREKYGPQIGWDDLLRILEDRSCVRYPCEVLFEEKELRPGEVAYAAPKGLRPEEGFIIYVHPYFQDHLPKVPLLILYQLVAVNYGPFASADDAEVFGSNALGLEKEAYYQALCAMADEIGQL